VVRDNGVGFSAAGQKRSFGLQTMRERAQSVGGWLGVWSALGDGVRVECRIPCLPNERLAQPSVILE
jgi:signal transduction histidine kinase